jgi:hypothetical protein
MKKTSKFTVGRRKFVGEYNFLFCNYEDLGTPHRRAKMEINSGVRIAFWVRIKFPETELKVDFQ